MEQGSEKNNGTKAEVYNRNDLNQVHAEHKTVTDRLGEEMINGDNLKGRAGGRVE
ncbi:hypothetical protein [Peribacillus sp. SCS-155]|uniref:hypothetical protein n=1 Tax=Peribacillus sedimenti TaxID=3115297 RepID=UPI003905DDC6